jgi:hypothetical protein
MTGRVSAWAARHGLSLGFVFQPLFHHQMPRGKCSPAWSQPWFRFPASVSSPDASREVQSSNFQTETPMLASVASNVASQSQVSKSQLATLTDAHQAATHRNMLDESQEPNHGICELLNSTRAGAKSCVSQTSQELSATCPAASDMLGATTAHQILALGAQSGIRRLGAEPTATLDGRNDHASGTRINCRHEPLRSPDRLGDDDRSHLERKPRRNAPGRDSTSPVRMI